MQNNLFNRLINAACIIKQSNKSSHSSSRQNMQLSDEQITDIILSNSLRKAQIKSNPQDLNGIIDFIQRLNPNLQSFEVVFELIKMFNLSILRCFEPFYKKIDQAKCSQQHQMRLEIIENAVLMLNPEEFRELEFFKIFGAKQHSKFIVKPISDEERYFICERYLIAKWIDIKSNDATIQALPQCEFQLIRSIALKNSLTQTNPFIRYYIDKLVQDLLSIFQVQTLEDLRTKSSLLYQPKAKFQMQKIPEPKHSKLSLKSNLSQATVDSDSNSQLKKEKMQQQKVVNKQQQIIWKLNSNDQIFYRQSNSEEWKKIKGSLRKLSVASDGRLWGVNANEDIYTRPGVHGDWQQIKGKLVNICAQENGKVRGINRQNKVYVRNKVEGKWTQVPEQFHQRSEPNFPRIK